MLMPTTMMAMAGPMAAALVLLVVAVGVVVADDDADGDGATRSEAGDGRWRGGWSGVGGQGRRYKRSRISLNLA